MKRKHSSEHGFTLIETTIALIILVVALLGVASIFAYTIKYNSGAGDREMALVVAQQQMEKLRNVPFNSPELNATAGTQTTVTNAKYSYNVLVVITDEPSTRKTDNVSTRKTLIVTVTPENPSSSWAKAPVVLVTQRSSNTVGPYIG